MLEQGFYGVVMLGKLVLGEQRMNLSVTDAMEVLRDSPAFRLGNQMVGIALRFRNVASTEWANRFLHLLVGSRSFGHLLELPPFNSSLHGPDYEGSRGLPDFKTP